jgi:hypothetical protein
VISTISIRTTRWPSASTASEFTHIQGLYLPWATLWYEHDGIDELPYDGRTVTWGIEFGTCALPLSRMEMLTSGPMLGRPRFGVLPAHTTLRTSYEAILQRIPTDWRGVGSIERRCDALVICERDSARELRAGDEP